MQVRTDRAPALRSLASRPDKQLESNGIDIVLGEQGNPNSNCSVDSIIKDLEAELRRLNPGGGKLDSGTLSLAVTTLNNKVRQQGFSSSQIHFSRDSHTGTNIPLQDERLREAKMENKARANPQTARSKAPQGKEHVQSTPLPGQFVYLKSDLSKHEARDPLLVTSVEKEKVVVQKMLHSTPQHQAPPKIVSQKMRIDEKFLYIPPHKRGARAEETKNRGSEDPWWRKPPLKGRGPPAPAPPRPPWNPIKQFEDGDDDYAVITTTWVPATEQVQGGGEDPEVGEEEVQGEVGEGEIQGEVGGENQVEPDEGQEDPIDEEGGDDQQEGVEQAGGGRKRGRDSDEEEQEEAEHGQDGEEGDLPPESFENPPWPPAPRRRLLGVSGRPMKKVG